LLVAVVVVELVVMEVTKPVVQALVN
jgi:hypothetical protein